MARTATSRPPPSRPASGRRSKSASRRPGLHRSSTAKSGSSRPGLAKAREDRLGSVRRIELWRSADYRVRSLFESADVMSEGATRDEHEGPVYYGTTSVLLVFSKTRPMDPERSEHLARLLANDPHARLRAVRIARLEAQLRAEAPIGSVRADLSVKPDPRGVRLDVEVEANVFQSKARSPKRARGSRGS